MSKNRVRELYMFAINLVINYFLLLLISDSLEIEYSLKILFILFISTIFFQITWSSIFNKPILLPSLLVIALLIGIYVYNFYEDTYSGLIITINDFLGWTFRFLGDLTFIHETYLNILLIIIALIISFITHILTYRVRKTFPLIVIGTVFFLYRWFLYSERAILYYVFYIIAVLQLYVYRVYIEKEDNWKNSGRTVEGNIFKSITIYSLIVAVTLVGVAAFLPRNFEPITWRWLDDRIQKEFPELSKWRNTKKTSIGYGSSMQFDLSFTKYQDSYKRLGGPIEQDNILLLRVTSPKSTYLKGRVKDMYTGSYWRSTNDNFIQQLTSTNIRLLDQEEPKGELIVQKIEHVNLTTSSIFNSYIPTRVKLNNNWFYVSNENEIFSGSLILKNSSYRVFSVEPNIDWSIIKDSQYKPKEIFKKYLQIPEIIPKRVVELSKNITKNHKSDYDKVQALVEFLRSSYNYSLSPPETPYNRDFVDYFLFDLKEGYCTYFASSLAMMSRSIGIPSRYVEGFKLPQDKEENKYYNVYSSDAHAWVEVFIEGYGWMVFESTPLYEDVVYIEEETEEGDFLITPNDELNPKNRENQMMDKDVETNENSYINMIDQKKPRDNTYFDVIKYILLTLVLIVLILVMKIMTNLIRIRRLGERKDIDNSSLFMDYYLWILNILRIVGRGKDISETSTEYSIRISEVFGNEMKDFDSVTRIFNKARYGGEIITKEEITLVKQCYLKLEGQLKEKVGITKYLYYKYISMEIYKTKTEG